MKMTTQLIKSLGLFILFLIAPTVVNADEM